MPQIEVLGVMIAEPTTMLTDYVVAIACGWFAARLLFSEPHRQHFCRRAWAVGFVLVGLGLILGGTAHGFVFYLSAGTMNTIWKLAFYAAGISMALFVAGTIAGSVPARSWRRILHGLNILGLLAFIVRATAGDGDFLSVIIISVGSLGIIALIETWVYFTQGLQSAKWLVGGVFVYFVSAAIQRSGIELHEHFNHNDLYHVVLLGGLYLLYRGVELLQDRN